MCNAGVQVQLVTTVEELEEMVPVWVQLCEADRGSTPFQRPEWLLPWWRQFGTDDGLRVAIVRRNGEPRALLPFYLYREPGSGQVQLQMIGVGTTDYLDGIFAEGCGEDEVMAGLAVLAANGEEWEVMHASQLRTDSLLRRCLLSGRVLGYDSESCSRGRARRTVELPTKLRRNVMYYGNVARRRGNLRLCVTEAQDLQTVLDEFVELHTQRWESVGEPGVMADERVIAWHREALPRLQRAGLLRFYKLLLDKTTVAIMYALVDTPGRLERVCYCYLPAFATQFRELRPGTLLLAYLQEAMVAEGVGTIDMLRGDEPYKQHWEMQPVRTSGVALTREELSAIAGAVRR